MQTNPVYQNIIERRSVRSFTRQIPAADVMEMLVSAGQYAPTGMGRQNTAFISVTNPDLVAVLSRLNADVMRRNNPAYSGDPFYGAPAVIAVLAQDGPNAQKNGSAAMENILLAASAAGLGACWINRAYEVFAGTEGRQLLRDLQIPEDYVGVGFVITGYPSPDAVHKEVPERTSLVRIVS